jgi:hypothetical protein
MLPGMRALIFHPEVQHGLLETPAIPQLETQQLVTRNIDANCYAERLAPVLKFSCPLLKLLLLLLATPQTYIGPF